MAFQKIKEYISTADGAAGTLLIPRLILPPLIDAVDKALLPREMAAMVKTGFEGPSFYLNRVTPDALKSLRNAVTRTERLFCARKGWDR